MLALLAGDRVLNVAAQGRDCLHIARLIQRDANLIGQLLGVEHDAGIVHHRVHGEHYRFARRILKDASCEQRLHHLVRSGVKIPHIHLPQADERLRPAGLDVTRPRTARRQ